MDIFEKIKKVNQLIENNKESEAQEKLIQILAEIHWNDKSEYAVLINHLLRQVGLYPYILQETSSWQEKIVKEAFKVDIGEKEEFALHREQSVVLKKLLKGKDIAISAPTSFGKSFIIDAFIKIKTPNTVMIIVPTIALTDETRRRLQRKFSKDHKIITQTGESLEDKNIFIFPQEKAIDYFDKIKTIDLLVVDEFYKASTSFDDDRAAVLDQVLLKFQKIAKQRYFLAPNITKLKENPLTKGVEFINKLNFNTVYTKRYEWYKEFPNKEKKLLEIIEEKRKSLIFAGTYAQIDKVATILESKDLKINSELLNHFSNWLHSSYSPNYSLANYVKKGIGIHNGRLHRSLSQIQVKLFAEETGLQNMICTSSIIEGVNTAAENVIVWSNKNGGKNMNHFTYKNLIGRGGRMFKYFIGHIHILEKPPKEKEVELDMPFDEKTMASIPDLVEAFDQQENEEVKKFERDMQEIIGIDKYNEIKDSFQIKDKGLLFKLAEKIEKNSYQYWDKLSNLNQPCKYWETILKTILFQCPFVNEVKFEKELGIDTNLKKIEIIISFIQKLSRSWENGISSVLNDEITIEKYFELEGKVTYNIANFLQDVQTLYNAIHNKNFKIDGFIAKCSHAFLPKLVYQLEEYGLPRMLARKIQDSAAIDLEQKDKTPEKISVHNTIKEFQNIGKEKLTKTISNLHPFDDYILDYFYEGITLQ